MTAAPPPFQSKHEPTSFFSSALHAWDGLLHVVVHQRNMRMHVIAALLVAQVGQGVPLGLAEKVTLIFCVMMVFFAEILNTALEQLVDLATEQLHEKARVTKDAAAAGVAVLAIGTVVIFAAILVHDASTIFANLSAIERQVTWGGPFVVACGVLMHEAKKPVALDAVVALAALGLWARALAFSESEVFAAMSLGLWILCGSAAVVRQRGRARASAGLKA